MREIKFRAWDKRFKNMIYDKPMAILYLNDSDHELMQYTGLHDSYGNEEYFSDIIEDEDGIRRIIEDGCSAVWFTNTQESKDVKYFWEITKPHKVIGNIYENPELLEV